MTAALIAASRREQLAVCCWQEPRGGRGSSLLGSTFISLKIPVLLVRGRNLEPRLRVKQTGMRYGFQRKSLHFGIAASFLATGLGVSATFAHTRKKPPREMTGDERIVHALNRLAFGPRGVDVAGIRRIGVSRWIEQQLYPETIPENPVLEMKLRPLETLQMSSADLEEEYPRPATLRAMAEGRLPLPAEPGKRALIRELAQRLDRKQGVEDVPPAAVDGNEIGAQEIESMTPEGQIEALAALPRPRLRQLSESAPVELQRRILMLNSPMQVVNQDLAAAKLLRAVYSNRQLEEVLTDFWYNHFNVFLDKGADRYFVTAYERDVIRPHVLGKFRDLLEATAKSPAMLFYLDNWQSVGPQPPPRGGRAGATQRRGLNENYGRELLELHTLGVDGGYTQKDVTEVARCFTGWSINQPQRGGEFVFRERQHDRGEKVVLGVTIPAGGGIEDGEKVLDIVARHPSTARFISRKLAQRFVADDPPPALVDRMAQTFLKTGGDLRAVMKTMIDSKEFWSVGAYRSKIKSPFEMVVSAVRAVNGDVDFAQALMKQVAQLGEPLYRKVEPTGYSNASGQWLNSAGLLARMNFAVQLASNKVPGVKVESADAKVLGSPEFQKR